MTSFAPQLLKQAFYDPSKIPPGTLERNARALKIKGWEAGLLAFTRDSSAQASVLKLDDLKTIQAPALLIWGENDAIVPVSVGQRLRDLLPNDTWISYPKVGHVPQDENTAAFNQDLIVFLGKE
jgi:pimeloyl-ACP methyl ester carboxylesterase